MKLTLITDAQRLLRETANAVAFAPERLWSALYARIRGRKERLFDELAYGGTDAETGVYWPPFSGTAAYRDAAAGLRSNPPRLMQASGALRAGAAEILKSGGELEIGSRVPYAAAMNARRPFLFFADGDFASVAELIIKGL